MNLEDLIYDLSYFWTEGVSMYDTTLYINWLKSKYNFTEDEIQELLSLTYPEDNTLDKAKALANKIYKEKEFKDKLNKLLEED